jgi:hypothetical protein
MLFDRFDIVDADTHITEPPDTWTARMPSKWGDAIPHIERIDGFDVWVVNGTPYAKPGNTAMAGFDGTLPEGPATYDDMHPGTRWPGWRSWTSRASTPRCSIPTWVGSGPGRGSTVATRTTPSTR